MSEYHGKHDGAGWPEGVSESEKRALTDAARVFLAHCPLGVEGWVIYESILRTADIRGALMDWRYAVAERAVRAADAERVWRQRPGDPPELNDAQWSALLAVLSEPAAGLTRAQILARGHAPATFAALERRGLVADDARGPGRPGEGSGGITTVRATPAGRAAWMARMVDLVSRGHQEDHARAYERAAEQRAAERRAAQDSAR